MEEEKKKAIAAGSRGASARGKIVMATVKGDVHDIGKNIVGVVLASATTTRSWTSASWSRGRQDSQGSPKDCKART